MRFDLGLALPLLPAADDTMLSGGLTAGRPKLPAAFSWPDNQVRLGQVAPGPSVYIARWLAVDGVEAQWQAC